MVVLCKVILNKTLIIYSLEQSPKLCIMIFGGLSFCVHPVILPNKEYIP